MPKHLMIHHIQLHFVPVSTVCAYELVEGLGEKVVNCGLTDSSSFPFTQACIW